MSRGRAFPRTADDPMALQRKVLRALINLGRSSTRIELQRLVLPSLNDIDGAKQVGDAIVALRQGGFITQPVTSSRYVPTDLGRAWDENVDVMVVRHPSTQPKDAG